MDDAEFVALCAAARDRLGKTDSEMADALMVSRPTFQRWLAGRNLPHPTIRESLAKWMRGKESE